MKKIFLYALFSFTACYISCDENKKEDAAQTGVTITIKDNDPFNQSLKGNVKKITRFHYYVLPANADSADEAYALKIQQTRVTTYDTTGNILTCTDTLHDINSKPIHRIMEFRDNILTGWKTIDKNRNTYYRAIVTNTGDTLFTTIVTKPGGDTAYIDKISKHKQPVSITEHRQFHESKGLIYQDIKKYSYDADGYIKNCNYIMGLYEGDTTEFEVMTRDSIGNTATLVERWTGAQPESRIIEFSYEYYK